jgi:predicted amidohydrolase YtcJ
MLQSACRYPRGRRVKGVETYKTSTQGGGIVRLYAVVFLALTFGCSAERQQADLILTGGAIYTMNPTQPQAQAIAVSGGRIVAVGSNEQVKAEYQSDVDIELNGQMVLPGFVDAHMHPVSGGVELAQCDLNEMATVDAILAKVKACGIADPGTGWLVGGGWNLALFPQANPNKSLLDGVSVARPILLGGADGHSSWANSRALAMAGIGRDTPNPPNGVIERDAAGEASGTLRETAQDLVRAFVPPLSPQAREDGLMRALAMANGYGITSFTDAAAGVDELAAYEAIAAQGKLTARVVASIKVTEPNADALMHADDRGNGARLRRDSAKIFIDGVLEGETAALLEPYLDRPGHMGQLNVEPQQLSARVVDLDRRGIQVHMHAIGDRAVRVALDAVAAARAANGPSDNRHHIAHLQLVDAADRARFAQLGVVANFQALWAFPDHYVTDVNLPQVGQARVDQMYPIASVSRAGATIVGGSDWSVSSMNPLPAIETAVTRSDPSEQISGVLNENERIPLADMLAAFTKNGAYLLHQEHDTGTIEVGKLADLVVLRHNLFEIPPDQIGEVEVTQTLLEGKTVFAR